MLDRWDGLVRGRRNKQPQTIKIEGQVTHKLRGKVFQVIVEPEEHNSRSYQITLLSANANANDRQLVTKNERNKVVQTLVQRCRATIDGRVDQQSVDFYCDLINHKLLNKDEHEFVAYAIVQLLQRNRPDRAEGWQQLNAVSEYLENKLDFSFPENHRFQDESPGWYANVKAWALPILVSTISILGAIIASQSSIVTFETLFIAVANASVMTLLSIYCASLSKSRDRTQELKNSLRDLESAVTQNRNQIHQQSVSSNIPKEETTSIDKLVKKVEEADGQIEFLQKMIEEMVADRIFSSDPTLGITNSVSAELGQDSPVQRPR